MLYKTTVREYIYSGRSEALRRIIAKMVENKDVSAVAFLRGIFEVRYDTGLTVTLMTKEDAVEITITSNNLEEVKSKAEEFSKIIEGFLKEQEK